MNVPIQTARGASIAGRLFGAGLALLVAISQSYDPTQVFASVVALLILATLFPLSGAVADAVILFGAGVVFFAGAVLTGVDYGLAMLGVGIFGGLAGLALAHRSGRGTVLPAIAFVAAVFITGAIQAAIVFFFE